MKVRISLLLLLSFLGSIPAAAHVGSPDVYADAQAGPYRLSVVIRPPVVIPGVADIEVRSQSAGVQQITITPVPLIGEGSNHPPVPDPMQQPSGDKSYFTGHLWIMATGSWQIRFAVSGAQGTQTVSIPLPAAAMATRKMQSGLGLFLGAMGLLLVVGMIGIVGAASREAKLPPGIATPPANRRSARIAMTVAAVALIAGVWLGNVWWNSEAASYSENIYKPLQMNASLTAPATLHLEIHDPGWLSERHLDDFIPDHDHVMHLYAIRWPEMDVVFHLHPQPSEAGKFTLGLPSMPAGEYRLFADVVHKNGFPETIVGSITVPAIDGIALAGDDAAGKAPPISTRAEGTSGDRTFRLPDGYTMVWKLPGTLAARAPESFEFELLDRSSHPATDEALYMGMLGHAAFVKTDGSVFAHIHPNGSMSMAALMMANPQSQMQQAMNGGASMPGMTMSADHLPASVTFPYGFPSAGSYRIIVQMKHGQTVETGIFDAVVSAAAN